MRYFRSRWTCELFAELLREQHGIHVSGETVRRGLHHLGFAWRRPRPMVGPSDPDYAIKLRQIRRLLCRLPTDEVAVFQDEVDLHLNPKIGACWMLKGQQATVETPGNNIKRHLAGAGVAHRNAAGEPFRQTPQRGIVCRSSGRLALSLAWLPQDPCDL